MLHAPRVERRRVWDRGRIRGGRGSASWIERLENRQLLATFTVDSLADAGPGSLRQAILDANAAPGADAVLLALAPGQTISPLSELPTITDPLVLDAFNGEPMNGPVLRIDGAMAGALADGLRITTGPCLVRGLAITNFSGAAIRLAGAADAQIAGNSLGVDLTGITAAPNGFGLIIEDAPGVVVGGAEGLNVISGNTSSGIAIIGSTSIARIEGNFIGTNREGTAALPNGGDGITISGASNSLIIGNVISGNIGNGVSIAGATATGNRIEQSRIGTNAAGNAAIGNRLNGVLIDNGASANIIGGSAAGRNLVSGNTGDGVSIDIEAGSGNRVAGNFVGTDLAGAAALGNGLAGVSVYSDSNVVGGEIEGEGNLISANANNVVVGGTQNLVMCNLIGTNAAGTAAMASASVGVIVWGADNLIAGTTTRPQLVSGNLNGGLIILGSSNTVQGNYIGTDISGLAGLGNGTHGILIAGESNTVGGTTAVRNNPDAVAANLISGNDGPGVILASTGVYGNEVSFNLIGTDITGLAALPNMGPGVLVEAGFAGNLINHNVVSGNEGPGVALVGNVEIGADNNRITANRIGVSYSGTVAIPNTSDGIQLVYANGNRIGGTGPEEGNLIAHNGGKGVAIAFGSGNTIRRNFLFDNAGIPIDLNDDGPTPNDPGDLDHGANELLNYPVLSNVHAALGFTMADVQINTSWPLEQIAFDFYAGGRPGDASVWVGGTIVAMDATGSASFGVALNPIPAGWYVTAAATAPDGSTSELNPGVGLTSTSLRVTTNADSGPGSLRQAILDANADPDQSSIEFDLGEDFSIQLVSPLPDILHTVVLDGKSQRGYDGTPIIVLDGSSLQGPVSGGLVLAGSGTVVAGLAIVNFPGDGIRISGWGNAVLDCVISGNADNGILLIDSSDNAIRGNTLTGNDRGITAAAIDGSATRNLFSRNRIDSNASIGIDLGGDGATANDLLDVDTGPNNLQNTPLIRSVNPGTGTIRGTLHSAPEQTFTIEFFASASGLGQVYLGSTEVTTSISGDASFSFDVNPAMLTSMPTVTATATDGLNNTSEFGGLVPYSLMASGTSLAGYAGFALGGQAVAGFSDDDPESTGASFTAMINWGDDSASTPGMVEQVTAGIFTVRGSHTYGQVGDYTATVTITHADGRSIQAGTSVTIASSQMQLSPLGLRVEAGTSTDGQPAAILLDPVSLPDEAYSIIIDWGDNSTPSQGWLANLEGNGHLVFGEHTYADPGFYSLTVTVNRVGGDSISTVSSAIVTQDGLLLIVTPLVLRTGQSYNDIPVGLLYDLGFRIGTGEAELHAMEAGGLNVTIDWGDDTEPSIGTLAPYEEEVFQILGSHRYAAPGTYRLSITAADADRRITATGEAIVTGQSYELEGSGRNLELREDHPVRGRIVASFTDDDPRSEASNFTVTINWGDGSAPTSGRVVAGTAAGTFLVRGAHGYGRIGRFPVSITVMHDDGRSLEIATTVAVVPAPVQVAGVNVVALEGIKTGSVRLATFAGKGAAEDYVARVFWGDSQSEYSTGRIVRLGDDRFTVFGQHTWRMAGRYTVRTEIYRVAADQEPLVMTADGREFLVGSAQSRASVINAPVLRVSGNVVARGVRLVQLPVLTFVDANPFARAEFYAATINWGDRRSSLGRVREVAPGRYEVLGSHTYARKGSYTLTLRLSDASPEPVVLKVGLLVR